MSPSTTALSGFRPVVVKAVVDPKRPPMPPKVTAKQAAHFAEALAKAGGKIAWPSPPTT